MLGCYFALENITTLIFIVSILEPEHTKHNKTCNLFAKTQRYKRRVQVPVLEILRMS